MNREAFIELLEGTEANDIRKVGQRLNQHLPEWQTFLEFVDSLFASRGVKNPVVVEIGILDGAQKRFYERILNATYIGIDVNPNAPAAIIGDSRSNAVLDQLKKILDGREIDLLFIDGLHTYEAAKSDYEKYSPLVRHITALHDILTPKLTPKDTVDVIRFWEELKNTNTKDTLITIQHHNPRPATVFNGRPLGIGIVLKGQVV